MDNFSIIVMATILIIVIVVLTLWQKFTKKDSDEELATVANYTGSIIFWGVIIIMVIVTMISYFN